MFTCLRQTHKSPKNPLSLSLSLRIQWWVDIQTIPKVSMQLAHLLAHSYRYIMYGWSSRHMYMYIQYICMHVRVCLCSCVYLQIILHLLYWSTEMKDDKVHLFNDRIEVNPNCSSLHQTTKFIIFATHTLTERERESFQLHMNYGSRKGSNTCRW